MAAAWCLIQIRAQSFHSDLPFVFVAVSPTETNHSIPVRAVPTVNDGERNQAVTPGSIQMEGDLIVVFAPLFEIDLFGAVYKSRHAAVSSVSFSVRI